MSHPTYTLGNGILGTGSISLGVLTSLQVEIEWWMRLVSLAAGLIVAGLTIYNLLKGPKRP